ncbi:hypothetical protein J6590_016321 [Homalodisca vitripennis]|nr:hypothetical protein J6590_016321 [Homalodisca vitripennis]
MRDGRRRAVAKKGGSKTCLVHRNRNLYRDRERDDVRSAHNGGRRARKVIQSSEIISQIPAGSGQVSHFPHFPARSPIWSDYAGFPLAYTRVALAEYESRDGPARTSLCAFMLILSPVLQHRKVVVKGHGFKLTTDDSVTVRTTHPPYNRLRSGYQTSSVPERPNSHTYTLRLLCKVRLTQNDSPRNDKVVSGTRIGVTQSLERFPRHEKRKIHYTPAIQYYQLLSTAPDTSPGTSKSLLHDCIPLVSERPSPPPPGADRTTVLRRSITTHITPLMYPHETADIIHSSRYQAAQAGVVHTVDPSSPRYRPTLTVDDFTQFGHVRAAAVTTNGDAAEMFAVVGTVTHLAQRRLCSCLSVQFES